MSTSSTQKILVIYGVDQKDQFCSYRGDDEGLDREAGEATPVRRKNRKRLLVEEPVRVGSCGRPCGPPELWRRQLSFLGLRAFLVSTSPLEIMKHESTTTATFAGNSFFAVIGNAG